MNVLMSDVMVYVSNLSWKNFRMYHAKGHWFKWRPNVCIWIAIPQWQSFISVLRILQDGLPYCPRHEYHLPTKNEEDFNPAQLHALLVSLMLRVDWGAERLIAQRMVYHERKGICEKNRGVEYGTV